MTKEQVQILKIAAASEDGMIDLDASRDTIAAACGLHNCGLARVEQGQDAPTLKIRLSGREYLKFNA